MTLKVSHMEMNAIVSRGTMASRPQILPDGFDNLVISFQSNVAAKQAGEYLRPALGHPPMIVLSVILSYQPAQPDLFGPLVRKIVPFEPQERHETLPRYGGLPCSSWA